MSFLIVPSALIQASGLAELSLSELRLWWRIIGHLSAENLPDDEPRLIARFPVTELAEPGDKSRTLLAGRLEAVSNVVLRANLDGRDGHELWRMTLRLVSEFELRDEWIEIEIGPRMYRAIRDRSTFTRIRESVLFAMRGSKYSALLYVLLRDKMNQRERRWEVEYPEFRTVMQVPASAYDRFGDVRTKVIEPAVQELNELSEFTITWSKARTFKNQVRALAFQWKLKDPSEARTTARQHRRHSTARGKVQQSADAPPMILLDRATHFLSDAPYEDRKRWWSRAKQLGAPDQAAPTATENVSRWVSWVAREMAFEGLIDGR